VTIRRVLVVGSGGREHALAWRFARDPAAPDVLVAPGSAGMTDVARRHEVRESDAAGLLALCKEQRVDLAVIGPEAPLATGVADTLEAGGVTVFGASRSAARLESSKSFAKEIMRAAGVRTARAEWHDALDSARRALDRATPPYVIKADGLAGGKGVVVTSARAEADDFLAQCLSADRFGESGRRVLIEEYLAGEEATVMAVCDGARFVLLPAARDYKRARDGDQGPNTGGMGAFAPLPLADAQGAAIGREIILPVLSEMMRRGHPLRGVLYCGLMMRDGKATVIEFNVRFGDPETEVVLPLLDGSLTALLSSAARGRVDGAAVSQRPGATVGVAIVDEGYPESVRGGGRLEGLDAVASQPELAVFHAASERHEGGWRIRGGRAAYVVAHAEDRVRARARVYAALAGVGGTGWRVRSDIAAGDLADRGLQDEAEVQRGEA
jgi:phosphoribosylamine---glycine ligase